MHTVWVLMAETGFVDAPFTVVKSYRRSERGGRPSVVPVELGIQTFYKASKASRPREVASEDQVVFLDPRGFKSDVMRRVFTEARRFAQLNVPVLIRGERGTGKTTLASWIRSSSPYKREEQDARRPSVACGRYTAETMRAELFGYKKGSSTGACSDRPGLLAAAHRDTLFLDDVGDISPDLQRLLIRAIEVKRYFALGDDTPRESDFRLLTATNIDDCELRERFYPDFLDCISLLTLTLPPLRDVREELPWLWEAAYGEAARRASVAKQRSLLNPQHHSRVVATIAQHPLRGNLRDLFRIAYRILAARNDTEDPMTPAEAVIYGLEALVGGGEAPSTSVSRAVAAAFARGAPIEGVIEANGSVRTAEVLADLKAFIATKLRRTSAAKGLSLSGLCDVSERPLRGWARASRKLPADERQVSSGRAEG